jgi:O-antigen/teichoic acid export membrane protein
MTFAEDFFRILRKTRLRRDVPLYVVANLSDGLTKIIAIPILTRIFVPEDYGIYSLLIAAFALFTALSARWVASTTIRFFISYRTKNNLGVFFGSLSILLLGASVVSGGVIGLVTWFIRGGLPGERFFQPLFLVFASGIINAFTLNWLTALRADLRAKRFSVLSASYFVSRYLLGVLFVFLFGQGILGFFQGWTLASLVFFVLTLWAISHDFKIRPQAQLPRYFAGDLKILASFGLPLLGFQLANWGLQLSNRYVLQFLRGEFDVGIFSVAYALANRPIFLIASGLQLAVFPVMIKFWEEKGQDTAVRFIRKSLVLFLILVVPIFLVLLLFGKPLLGILSPAKYNEGYVCIPWVAAGVFLKHLAAYFNRGFELRKKVVFFTLVGVGTLVLNVAFNFLLIPSYGYLGAAVATFLAFTGYFLASVIFGLRVLPLRVQGKEGTP